MFTFSTMFRFTVDMYFHADNFFARLKSLHGLYDSECFSGSFFRQVDGRKEGLAA